ncbi:DNA methyltransferase 1-associated 1, partial, partial [Paramuricea clavata]
LKMPNSVGTKKSKAVEMLLEELRVELVPMPTEEICKKFNELRNDIILLYDLKQASTNCEFELQSLRHRYETLVPGKDIAETVPSSIAALSGITPSTTGSATPLIDNVIAPLAAANAVSFRFLISSNFLKVMRFLKSSRTASQ